MLMVVVLGYVYRDSQTERLDDGAEAIRREILNAQHQAYLQQKPVRVRLSDIALPLGVTIDLAHSKGIDEFDSVTFGPNPGENASGSAFIRLCSAKREVWVSISEGTGVVKVRQRSFSD